MKSLQHYISRYNRKKTKMWNVISRAFSGQFMSICNNFRPLISTKIIQQHFSSREIANNMCMIDCPIYLKPIMTMLEKNISPIECFNDMLGGTAVFENQEYIYKDVFIFEAIAEAMKKNQFIYLTFGFEDYDVDNIKGINEYCAHSTCALLIPNKKKYDCYYMNVHGRDMKETNYYKKIVTNKRCRVYHYKKPLDVIFMKAFCGSFNTTNAVKINYNNTYRYTYMGTNFQSGDGYGVCFIFPFIMFHYICNYLTRPRYFEVDGTYTHIESGIQLLKKGRLGFFVECMFADFTKNYKKILCQDITYTTKREHLETFVIKNAGNFLKDITAPMMSFMMQIKIKCIIDD
jgi:hypothetical protein